MVLLVLICTNDNDTMEIYGTVVLFWNNGDISVICEWYYGNFLVIYEYILLSRWYYGKFEIVRTVINNS